MKSLFSATAALALMVAAGHAGAQTSADQPANPSSMQNNSSMSSSPAPAADAAKSDSSSTAADNSSDMQSVKPHRSTAYSHSEASANRREAKITDKLNEQELAKDDKGASPEGSTGSSSTTTDKMHHDWKNGHQQPSSKMPTSDSAGSGSSSGTTASPSAGSDTVGDTQAHPSSQMSGDKAAAPDSNAPEFSNGMTNPNNGSNGH
jgi:hypothetical protein